MQNDRAEGKKESRIILIQAKIGRRTPKGSSLWGVSGLGWTDCVDWGDPSNGSKVALCVTCCEPSWALEHLFQHAIHIAPMRPSSIFVGSHRHGGSEVFPSVGPKCIRDIAHHQDAADGQFI